MRMETEYLLTAKTQDAIERIANIMEESVDDGSECSIEGFETTVFDVMEKVVKLVHQMTEDNQKDEFNIVGKCETDYDCVVFSIDYTGEEPTIKASQADPEENEARYYTFCEADYDEIPKYLKRNKNRTFKQAIKDELPLGGFLDMSYDEWLASILE